MEAGKTKGPEFSTLKKVMTFRKWLSSVSASACLDAIRDLEVVYIPQGMEPGPGFLFPLRDVTGEVKRAQIRLFPGNDYGDMRYLSIGDKTKFIGPAWVGVGEAAIASIISSREVLLVEGPFDLLAIRTIAPGLPSLCSTTKRLQDNHWDYLKILGVETIHIMFDNETSGRGEQAAEIMAENPRGFRINPVKCPAHDPSDALKTVHHLEALRNTLRGITPRPTDSPVLVLDDED